MNDSADVDFDEQVGDWLRRGDQLWIGPPRTPLPMMDEQPGPPWFCVGKMPEGYDPPPQRPWRGEPIYGLSCQICGERVARANGIFVHAHTGKPESLRAGHHYARPALDGSS